MTDRQALLSARGLTKRFGGLAAVNDVSLDLWKGRIHAVIGPNGAGKSTLFKLIAGKEKPDTGTVVIGSTVKMAFVDQNRDDLANDKTVWEDVSGGLDNITAIVSAGLVAGAYHAGTDTNGAAQATYFLGKLTHLARLGVG